MSLLEQWVKADAAIKTLQKEKRDTVTKLDIAIAEYEKAIAEYKAQIDAEMKANGVIEDIYEGNMTNFKVCYQKQPEKVVIDEDAVPDEYCRIKREPNKTAIKEMLQSGVQTNWARLERGEDKLTYKVVKK